MKRARIAWAGGIHDAVEADGQLELLTPAFKGRRVGFDEVVWLPPLAPMSAHRPRTILEEESKKNPGQRLVPEFGSDKDFQLQQALNKLKGRAVLVSKTQTERTEEKKEN